MYKLTENERNSLISFAKSHLTGHRACADISRCLGAKELLDILERKEDDVETKELKEKAKKAADTLRHAATCGATHTISIDDIYGHQRIDDIYGHHRLDACPSKLCRDVAELLDPTPPPMKYWRYVGPEPFPPERLLERETCPGFNWVELVERGTQA